MNNQKDKHKQSILYLLFVSTAIILLSVPLSVHVIRIETDSNFTIGEYNFPEFLSILLLAFLICLIIIIILSVQFDRLRFPALLTTVIFLLTIIFIQIVRLVEGHSMKILDTEWPLPASFKETIILIVFSMFCIYLLGNNRFKKPGKPNNSLTAYFKDWHKYLDNLPANQATLLGLVVSLVIATPLIAVGLYVGLNFLVGAGLFDQIDIKQLAWVGIVGAQGSAVSILLRLQTDTKDKENSIDNFHNGLFKPFIGMSFAHLIFCVAKSKFIQIGAYGEIPSKDAIFLYVVLAFIIGFSERLGKDICLILSNKLGTANKKQ